MGGLDVTDTQLGTYGLMNQGSAAMREQCDNLQVCALPNIYCVVDKNTPRCQIGSLATCQSPQVKKVHRRTKEIRQ
jgi:hypothetical protein